MPTIVPRYLHLDLSKHVMRNISRFRLRAHTLKVEAAAWHEDGSCVCDQCPGEDEHVQNEVHALFICQDHRVCELRKHFSFLFSPFFEDFSAAQPFLLQQINNQLVHDFLFQQNNRLFLFLSELRGAMYEHLRVVPPGKRLRVPSCTRPEILGSG